MIGPAMGYNYDLKQLDLWDDQAQEWINPSFNGGTVTGATTFVGSVNISGNLVTNSSVIMNNVPVTVSFPGVVWNNGQILFLSP
jgi:hypothetical protein